MSNSKPSMTGDRLLEIVVQATITAVVMVGVTKLMQGEKQQEKETKSITQQSARDVDTPMSPSSSPRKESLTIAKVASHNSLVGGLQQKQQKDDDRQYMIKHNGNFTTDSALRSRTWFKNPTW